MVGEGGIFNLDVFLGNIRNCKLNYKP